MPSANIPMATSATTRTGVSQAARRARPSGPAGPPISSLPAAATSSCRVGRTGRPASGARTRWSLLRWACCTSCRTALGTRRGPPHLVRQAAVRSVVRGPRETLAAERSAPTNRRCLRRSLPAVAVAAVAVSVSLAMSCDGLVVAVCRRGGHRRLRRSRRPGPQLAVLPRGCRTGSDGAVGRRRATCRLERRRTAR